MSPSTRSASPVLSHWRRIPGPPRDRVKARLLREYRMLLDRFGAPRPAPGRTPFEVAVGAILAQPAADANAALVALRAALGMLRRARLLTPKALARCPEARLARVAGSRSAGRRLKAFARWLVERHAGRVADLQRQPLPPLRAALTTRLGAETADAILLYAARRP